MWIEKIQAAAYNGASRVVSEFETHHFDRVYLESRDGSFIYVVCK